ncbi:F-box protein [Pyrus ussuriensis x Pyrus communis]|uniref:F-box protein n=1 Tax=Pyrus ussuriensis x Pyrus communis TaxID=2448454 RepID=A0A5N5I7M4_9ROSA|nr:F-box protein [Pyrus ussuriensis x Pyrus communis]
MVDWAGLPRELIFSLAERMDSLEESVATKENYFTSELGPKHQVPLLILPQENGAATRKCYNLKKRKICELNLSELEDKLFLSSLGWLLTVSKKDLKFSLIHPLNHARIELPRPVPNMAPNLLSTFSIRKVYQSQTVSFCRPGHSEHWIRVCLHTPGILNDLTYYEGQLYAVNYCGHVFICDIEDPKQAEVRIVASEFPKEYLGPMMQIKVAYLVESAGDLLVVLCFFNPKTKFHATTGCRVFKVPFSDGNSWLDSEVKNLGNRSLFLCRNASSFSVEASDCSGWKPNCIYFMNNERVSLRVDMDMGIFNMDDGQIERPFDNSLNICYKGRNYETSHLWIEPSF